MIYLLSLLFKKKKQVSNNIRTKTKVFEICNKINDNTLVTNLKKTILSLIGPIKTPLTDTTIQRICSLFTTGVVSTTRVTGTHGDCGFDLLTYEPLAVKRLPSTQKKIHWFPS